MRPLVKFGVEVTGLVPRSDAAGRGAAAPAADGSEGWLVQWTDAKG